MCSAIVFKARFCQIHAFCSQRSTAIFFWMYWSRGQNILLNKNIQQFLTYANKECRPQSISFCDKSNSNSWIKKKIFLWLWTRISKVCVCVCVDTNRVGNITNHGPKFLLIINVYIYVSFLSPIWLPYGFWLFYLFPPLLLMHESAFAKPSFYIEGKSCKIQTHFQVNNSRLIFIEHLPCTRHSNKHFT